MPTMNKEKFFWSIFLTGLATLCLFSIPLPFEIGGINTSILEIISFPIFLAALFGWLMPRSPIRSAFLLLGLASSLPVVIGLLEGRGVTQILREFAPVTYAGFLFVGGHFRKFGYLSAEKMLKLVCWVASLYAAFYVLEDKFFDTTVVSQFWPHWRLLVALGIMILYARLAGISGMPRFALPIALAMFAVLLLYAVEIRTRALLLMIGVGVLQIFFGSFKAHRTGKKFVRPVTIGFIGGLMVYFVVNMVSESATLRSTNSIGRLAALMNGSGLDITAMWRLNAWQLAWEEAIASPIFGVGFGSYLLLDPWIRGDLRFQPSAMIHNTWLNLFYCGGLIYLTTYVYLFCRIYHSMGHVPENQERNAGVALVGRGMLLGYCIFIAFGTGFFAPNNALPLWFLLGFFCHPQRHHLDLAKHTRPLSHSFPSAINPFLLETHR